MKRWAIILCFWTLFLSLLVMGSLFVRGKLVLANSETSSPSSLSFAPGYTISLPILAKPVLSLFADDFSDPSSGWPVDESGRVRVGYQSGEYEIRINESYIWGGAVPPLGDIADYSVQADMRLFEGSSGAYGLIFDRQDWDHYYVFVVLPQTNEYGLLRYDPTWVELVPFSSSPIIHLGSASNRLRVERSGANIRLFINNELIAAASDDTYAGTFGEVGLFGQALNNIPVSVRFDNFLVEGLKGALPMSGGHTEESQELLIGTGEGAAFIRGSR